MADIFTQSPHQKKASYDNVWNVEMPIKIQKEHCMRLPFEISAWNKPCNQYWTFHTILIFLKNRYKAIIWIDYDWHN